MKALQTFGIVSILLFASNFVMSGQNEEKDASSSGWNNQIGIAADFAAGNLSKLSVLPYLRLKSPEKTIQWDTYFGFNYLRIAGKGENRDIDWFNQLNLFPKWKFQPNILISGEHSTLLDLEFRGLYGLGVGKDILDNASSYLQLVLFGVAEFNNWAFENRQGEVVAREFWLTGPICRVNGIHFFADDKLNISYDWIGFFPLNRRTFKRMTTTISLSYEVKNQISLLIMGNMTNEGWTPPGIRKNNLYLSFGLAVSRFAKR